MKEGHIYRIWWWHIRSCASAKTKVCDKHFAAMIAIWNLSCIEASAPSPTVSLVKENWREQSVIFYFLNDLVQNDTTRLPSLSRTHICSSSCTIFYVIKCRSDLRPRLPPSSTISKNTTRKKRDICLLLASLLSVYLSYNSGRCTNAFAPFNEMFAFQTNS
jgi:hypothetical protein